MTSLHEVRGGRVDDPTDWDCPWCGQEIPSDDFVFDGAGWIAICYRCDREVMQ